MAAARGGQTRRRGSEGDRDDYWARTRESSSGSQLAAAAAAAAVWRRSSAPLLATGTSHARTAQTAVLVRYSCTAGTVHHLYMKLRALVTLVRNEGQRASHVRRRVRLCTAVRLYGCTAHSRTVASSYGSRSAYSLQLATPANAHLSQIYTFSEISKTLAID